MRTLILLLLITVFYAAYNLLVKVSSSHVGSVATTPILATLCLQAAALTVSIVYVIFLTSQSVSIALPSKALIWAIAGGVCIGLAEVLYFYLFRGVANEAPINASTAIPFIVGGTIVIAVAISHLVFKEALNIGQWIGVSLSFVGMIVLAINSQ